MAKTNVVVQIENVFVLCEKFGFYSLILCIIIMFFFSSSSSSTSSSSTSSPFWSRNHIHYWRFSCRSIDNRRWVAWPVEWNDTLSGPRRRSDNALRNTDDSHTHLHRINYPVWPSFATRTHCPFSAISIRSELQTVLIAYPVIAL